ncbi:MAG: hypothetical protein ABI538_08275 [Pseudoxanthomonas sp.]
MEALREYGVLRGLRAADPATAIGLDWQPATPLPAPGIVAFLFPVNPLGNVLATCSSQWQRNSESSP